MYAGQGVHYPQARDELQVVADRLAPPVATSLSRPEDHPLSLVAGGQTVLPPVHQVIADTDCPNGIGCSLTATVYDIDIPSESTFIHAPLDPGDVDKDVTHTMAMDGTHAYLHGALRKHGLFGDYAAMIKTFSRNVQRIESSDEIALLSNEASQQLQGDPYIAGVRPKLRYRVLVPLRRGGEGTQW